MARIQFIPSQNAFVQMTVVFVILTIVFSMVPALRFWERFTNRQA